LTADVSSSELGTYVVSWQVFAADTHPSRGAFSFDVGRPSANPYAALMSTGEIGTATPFGLALQALARWVHFAGFALVFGVAGYRWLTQGGAGFSRMTGAGVALLIAAEPLALIAQLASLSFARDEEQLLSLLLDGMSAHAIPGLPGVGQLLVAIHVSAMGMWVGGLAAYLVAPDRRFGRYAATTFATAVVTGLVLAFAHTASFDALITTEYGWVLLVKALIVGAVFVAVVLRRRRLELGIALAVVGAAAVLGALPPSR
jgi:putative copper export protein